MSLDVVVMPRAESDLRRSMEWWAKNRDAEQAGFALVLTRSRDVNPLPNNPRHFVDYFSPEEHFVNVAHMQHVDDAAEI